MSKLMMIYITSFLIAIDNLLFLAYKISTNSNFDLYLKCSKPTARVKNNLKYIRKLSKVHDQMLTTMPHGSLTSQSINYYLPILSQSEKGNLAHLYQHLDMFNQTSKSLINKLDDISTEFDYCVHLYKGSFLMQGMLIIIFMLCPFVFNFKHAFLIYAGGYLLSIISSYIIIFIAKQKMRKLNKQLTVYNFGTYSNSYSEFLTNYFDLMHMAGVLQVLQNEMSDFRYELSSSVFMFYSILIMQNIIKHNYQKYHLAKYDLVLPDELLVHLPSNDLKNIIKHFDNPSFVSYVNTTCASVTYLNSKLVNHLTMLINWYNTAKQTVEKHELAQKEQRINYYLQFDKAGKMLSDIHQSKLLFKQKEVSNSNDKE